MRTAAAVHLLTDKILLKPMQIDEGLEVLTEFKNHERCSFGVLWVGRIQLIHFYLEARIRVSYPR